MSLDLENLVAIDVHTHAEVGRTGEDGLRPEWRAQAEMYFGAGGTPTAEDVADYYRERNMATVIFTVDAAGRGDLGRAPQGAGVYRSLRLVPQVLPTAAHSLREHAAQGPRAVRLDYPMITPDRWLADFERADFKDEVRPLILKENAARMLGLR